MHVEQAGCLYLPQLGKAVRNRALTRIGSQMGHPMAWHEYHSLVGAERMMERNPYGSRPDLLPGFMNDRHADEGRQVVKLGLGESRDLEAVSLNRFPPTATAALDWEAGSYDDRRWWDDEEDWARMLAELLSSYVMEEKHVAIFWGNLVIPTVTLPARTVVEHAREILDAGPHFWIYPLGDSVLIECLMDGQVTVATIPPA